MCDFYDDYGQQSEAYSEKCRLLRPSKSLLINLNVFMIFSTSSLLSIFSSMRMHMCLCINMFLNMPMRPTAA